MTDHRYASSYTAENYHVLVGWFPACNCTANSTKFNPEKWTTHATTDTIPEWQSLCDRCVAAFHAEAGLTTGQMRAAIAAHVGVNRDPHDTTPFTKHTISELYFYIHDGIPTDHD